MKHLNSKSKISIIGMGYVGLPLAEKLSQHYKVIGFDIDKKRIGYLKKNVDLNSQISFSQLSSKKIFFTSTEENLKDTNLFIITVPTPIFKNKKPDLRPLQMASKTVAKYLRKNSIVVYESTVYPGCTKNFCIPILSKFSKLKYNKDFFCGYSPERINVGDKINTIENIIKIVSGSSPEVSKVIKKVYQKISIKNNIFLAKSIEIAEAAKIIENIQRDLNIAFINDILLFADQMNYNFNEIIRLASSKWNFLKFKPGLVGGHCLPVDPYYLNYVANLNKVKLKTLLAGRNVNDSMKKFVMKKVLKKISILKKADNKIKPKVLICGITYKKNVADIRNSLSLQIFLNLRKKYKNIYAYDYVCENKILKKYKIKKNLEINKDKYDIVVFLVDHKKNKSIYNYFKKQKKIIVDPFRLYFK